MNIAIFTDTFMPCTNGIVDAVWRISKGLKKAGNTVHIFALSDRNSDEVIEGVIVHKFLGRTFRYYEDYMMTQEEYWNMVDQTDSKRALLTTKGFD